MFLIYQFAIPGQYNIVFLYFCIWELMSPEYQAETPPPTNPEPPPTPYGLAALRTELSTQERHITDPKDPDLKQFGLSSEQFWFLKQFELELHYDPKTEILEIRSKNYTRILSSWVRYSSTEIAYYRHAFEDEARRNLASVTSIIVPIVGEDEKKRIIVEWYSFGVEKWNRNIEISGLRITIIPKNKEEVIYLIPNKQSRIVR